MTDKYFPGHMFDTPHPQKNLTNPSMLSMLEQKKYSNLDFDH